jgi:FKBP-type peptidyl-prolyl cis-trans isomerase
MLSLALLLAAAAPAPAAPPSKAPPAAVSAVTTASGLRFETLEAGTGPKPGPNDAVLVMYQGRLSDGTVFDESKEPVAFGVGDLIPGFTEGLQLMNQGGIYRLRIPSAIGYGATGSGGSIPPNADLEFTVLLLDIAKFEPAPAAPAAPAPAK